MADYVMLTISLCDKWNNSKEPQNRIIINLIKNMMDKLAITKTIIALETAALDAWHKGNPSPYLELYSNDFTYFDPAHERRIDGWNKIK